MKCTLKIYRGVPKKQYFEEFEIALTPGMNVIAALMQIRENPINNKGKKTTPVVWEDGCLEEVCGSCSMLINGRPRQACSAILEPILKSSGSSTITLAPFTKFPLLRDLCVDRSSMFEALKKVKAWIPVDGTWDRNDPSYKISPETQEALYLLSTCMTCGCCTESCPQVNADSAFMGPAVMSQVRLFNSLPQGAPTKADRLRAILGDDGIAGCGNAQNCAQVCPKKIPLTESIALIGKEATKQTVKDFFSLPDA